MRRLAWLRRERRSRRKALSRRWGVGWRQGPPPRWAGLGWVGLGDGHTFGIKDTHKKHRLAIHRSGTGVWNQCLCAHAGPLDTGRERIMLSRDRRLPDWLRFRLWADAGSKDAALKRAKPGRWRRWRIPSIAALSLAAVLLAAFAALPPLQTQAQAVTPTTFVSNTAQIPEADADDNILAQSFRTGANTEGDGVWSPSGTGTTGRTTITTDPPGVTVSETALTVTEEDTAGDSYRVVLDSQPTAEVVVTVAGHAGTEVTPSPASLTFTTSNWDTGQTVTVTAGSDADTVNDTVTLTHSAASADSDYDGNSITIASVAVTVNDDDEDTPAAGICGRTEQVRDALVELIPGGGDCAAVTAADLAAITDTLNLSGQNISALAAGDFAGLTGLIELYLNNNGLTTLPKDVFAGLTALKVLTLYYNELTTLPDGVFGQLTSLNFLYLGDNPRAPFAPTAVARPDAGTVLVAGGTVTLDGSGSGGPWGTNVTYAWALTTPESGVRVTFDDSTSATPEVTIPTLAAGTELTFTLTVTGRGGTDGIETATDTARVTATQNITNNPPVFAGGAVQARTFDETIGDTAVTSASDIGTPVSATDPDTGDTLEYSLLGADRAKFTFDTSSGQIKTRAGESYDYEARTSYSVRVAVIDGTVTVSSAVTINVTDQDEPPPVMNKPVVTATANSTTSLEVSWTEPSNPGRPRIDSYDLQYRVGRGTLATGRRTRPAAAPRSGT